MDLYREEILKHYRNPLNFGDLPDANVVVREANASCGDLIELSLKVVDSRIKDVRFKGVGCALSIASASLLTQELKGKPLAEVGKLEEEDVVTLVGIEVSLLRRKCILLPWRALEKALVKLGKC